jgi:adenylosuccinate lyase/3-carboxy-cis,cis-muconate cycloisomerase
VTRTTLDCVLLRDIFGTPAMRDVFDSRRLVQAWLDAEVALARAEARHGVVPQAAAERIAAEADAERFDLDALREGIADSQHPLVPTIRELATRCGEHGGHVHWGATTQDIMDTGMVLQLRDAIALLEQDVERACRAARVLALGHAETPMAGRTHGQHAVPITFGLKAASWADELERCARRLEAARDVALTVQLGGAAGTLASLGADAAQISATFAEELGLRAAPMPWHVARDRLRDLAHAVDQVGAAGERIAAEVIRLQSTEVAEVAEPATDRHVGSSTMPQKRNPMTCEYLVASARALHGAVAAVSGAAAHAGERDMALWAVEWLAIPQTFILAASVADKLAWVLERLEVHPERMSQNLALTEGAVMAEAAMMLLGRTLGHEEAHALVMRASRRAAAEGRPLLAVLSEEPAAGHLTAEELSQAMEPRAYLGWAVAVASEPAPAGDQTSSSSRG